MKDMIVIAAKKCAPGYNADRITELVVILNNCQR